MFFFILCYFAKLLSSNSGWHLIWLIDVHRKAVIMYDTVCLCLGKIHLSLLITNLIILATVLHMKNLVVSAKLAVK